ncbi:MAG TPA: HD-GYP domain-containing protein [Dehalococcoidales bacterium]|nr:HD-GYP domain-containing protein [Dehalococcoidales bacterium]
MNETTCLREQSKAGLLPLPEQTAKDHSEVRDLPPPTASPTSSLDAASRDLLKMKKIFEESVRAMGQMMEVRDPYTAGHQSRVSKICVEIARILKLPEHKIKGLELAALVHDVGKLAIPAEILSKPGRLTSFEFDLIKTHPMVGYDIMKGIEFPWPVADMILQHHERIDGSGYPKGLTNHETLLESRILSVADVIEAMSSNRPYRASLGLNLALEEICKNKSILYDADVVDSCLALFASSGVKG